MPDLTPLEVDEEEEDAWSYSFPPSNESLPILQQSQSKRSVTQPSNFNSNINSTFRTSQNGDNSSNNLQMKLLIDTTTTSSKSSLPFPSTIQKSTPLDPLTTKEDANSVISKDSKGNALNEASQSDDKPKFMKDLEEYGSTRNISNSPLSQQSTNEASLLPSPKFISYRKSKRTVSEGTFDSILDKSPMSPPASRYDTKLYVDEFYKDSKFRYATIKRNIDFHNNFHSLDLTDRLVDDFACALSREILLQGRIYLSESYICFNSNLLGWVTNLVIQLEEVVKIEKRSTAGLFPNAISIETVDGTLHTFASFLSRDQTHELMLTLWKGKTGKSNNDLTLTSEDELENGAIDSPNKHIESYILSLDGDDDDNELRSLDGSNEDGDESGLDIEEVLSTKLIKLKSESLYTNNGPDTHAPTTPNYEKLDAEIELVDEVIDAPMGIVFAILFGPYTKFQTNFLETHDGSEISEFGDFRPSEEDPAVLERKYIYRRELGYSIGPKSTKCEVTETIEHLNFADYIVVVSTTVTPDVPLGGVFSVKTRYVFSWANENHTNLLIYHHVEWTGRSWMKSVIEKLCLSGLTTTTKEMIKELKEEIVQQTYFIDGPPAVKQPLKKKVKKVEPELKNEQPKMEIKPSTTAVDVSSCLQQNITTAFFILFTIVTIIFFMQIRLYGLLRKSNTIAETQLLLTLQLSDLQQKPQVEVQDNVFWNLIHSKLGRKLTSLEKLQFLTYQLQAIHKEKTDDGNTNGLIGSIPKYIRDLI